VGEYADCSGTGINIIMGDMWMNCYRLDGAEPLVD